VKVKAMQNFFKVELKVLLTIASKQQDMAANPYEILAVS